MINITRIYCRINSHTHDKITVAIIITDYMKKEKQQIILSKKRLNCLKYFIDKDAFDLFKSEINSIKKIIEYHKEDTYTIDNLKKMEFKANNLIGYYNETLNVEFDKLPEVINIYFPIV